MDLTPDTKQHIDLIAGDTLNQFEKVADAAQSALHTAPVLGFESLASVNTMTSANAIQRLGQVDQENRDSLRRLALEPAIARVTVADEDGKQTTYYFCRADQGMPNLGIISYRARIGRLASLPVGEEFRLPNDSFVEVVESAKLRPYQAGLGWDSRDTVVEGDHYGPITIESLRAFLSKVAGAEITEDLLEQLLAEESETANVIEGVRRSVITKMGLRDQPVLDQYQDEIFRLPLDKRLLILGPPGTGKTTTLIRRLGQKLDTAFLDEDEQQIVESLGTTNGSVHASSWLMFTPTELLKQYLKEAFNREGVPASDLRIRTWFDYRRELARNTFGVLRTATGGGSYVLKDAVDTLSFVLERVEALAEFFRFHLGEEDAARRLAYHAGHAQCRACLESLRALIAQGAATIRPRQLQKLVVQATANGSDNPLLVAEVGANLAITQPGAAVEVVDRVIWWQLAAPVLPPPYPWSAAELAALRKAGVDLPEGERRYARIAEEWLRPVLAARRELLLVLPPEGEEVHPLWQMIEAVADKPRIETLERFLTEPSRTSAPVVHKPLPAPRRWWQLPDDVRVAPRGKESFTSLELLLFNPYHWLLKYPAKLNPSRVLTIGGDFRLMGTLAHDLVERYFLRADALKMNDAEFLAWFDPAFDQLLSEEGAILRMPGRGADLEGFRHRLRQALLGLRQQVARAGVVSVAPEMELSGQFAGGELSGFADLVMQKKDGAHAIVDMKWSGAKKYPEKLRQNRHLQLAIYAELLRQKEGAWPAVAYYILDRGRFFAPDRAAFPEAEVAAAESGENTARLWQRFLATWKWRRAQIESGAYEVVLESIPPTEESEPPEEAMEMEYLNEAYNDYRSLAGWGR